MYLLGQARIHASVYRQQTIFAQMCFLGSRNREHSSTDKPFRCYVANLPDHALTSTMLVSAKTAFYSSRHQSMNEHRSSTQASLSTTTSPTSKRHRSDIEAISKMSNATNVDAGVVVAKKAAPRCQETATSPRNRQWPKLRLKLK